VIDCKFNKKSNASVLRTDVIPDLIGNPEFSILTLDSRFRGNDSDEVTPLKTEALPKKSIDTFAERVSLF
jgi:hypothetical protein